VPKAHKPTNLKDGKPIPQEIQDQMKDYDLIDAEVEKEAIRNYLTNKANADAHLCRVKDNADYMQFAQKLEIRPSGSESNANDPNNEDDSDIEIEENADEYYTMPRCPLSLHPMVDPRELPCGHIFSKIALTQFISSKKTTWGTACLRCPQSGCNKIFKESEIKVARAMVKRIGRINRRNQLLNTGSTQN